MPVPLLPPFVTFERPVFHIGGNPAMVLASATKWRTFGETALTTASQLRGINDGGFVGDEGDKYRSLITSDFPDHLDTTGHAHVGVADALSRYSQLLTEQRIAMSVLKSVALGAHAAVNAAATDVNAAEAACAAAITPETQAVAQANLARARAVYQSALGVWESKKTEAQGIKDVLGAGVRAQVAEIAAQTRKRFEENPSWLGEQWENLKDFVADNAQALSFISDALQIIGAILLFIPGLNILGGILVGLGVALKGLLAASGQASWGEFFFDLATCGAAGGIAKLAKAGKFGLGAQKLAFKGSALADMSASAVKNLAKQAALKSAAAVSRVGGEDLAKAFYSKVTRGGKICFAAEPVDMATGTMVDFVTDVSIAGVLPLVVDRHSNTSHVLGRSLGPNWVSRIDTHIEITATEVLFVAPDGALLSFPLPPSDGLEVCADSTGWLLSFGDGAYRIRSIAQGLCYVFRVYELDADEQAGSVTNSCVTVPDRAPETSGSMVGSSIPSGSVAEVFDVGIEVGLSSIVHHTGHRIDCQWDQATGAMVAMVRSDGTRLDFDYDWIIHRLSGISVSNPTTDPDAAPQRLISYEYNQHRQLVRVRNSHDGVLSYSYDAAGRTCAWTDRNGVSYYYTFDDDGRVRAQVGTGGMFPNIMFWAEDEGSDAPVGGTVCVLIETAAPLPAEARELGDEMVEDYLRRLNELPLYRALCEHGLAGAGLTGCGRTGPRDDQSWSVPKEWLSDPVLGQIRPTVYRSTPRGDVWRIVSPEGRCVDAQHNEDHQVVVAVDESGDITRLRYNDQGLLVESVFPDGSVSAVRPGAWGAPLEVVSRDGSVTCFEVDDFGLTTAVIDADGARTDFDYELRESGVVLSSVTDSARRVVTVFCDDAGRHVGMVDAAGHRTHITRDVCGQVVSIVDPAQAQTRFEYSAEGWPVKVLHPDGSTRQLSYDGEGNCTSVTNECGAISRTIYTVFDKPAVLIDAAGGRTQISYNSQLEPIAVTNADNRTWTYTYDRDGRLASQSDYNQHVTTYAHNPAARTRTMHTPAGAVTSTFNAVGDLLSVADGDALTTFDYDHRGRMVGMSSPDARLSWQLSDSGIPLAETTTLPSGESWSVNFHYSPNKELAGLSQLLPDGLRVDSLLSLNDAGIYDAVSVHCSTATQEVALTHLQLGVDAAGRRNRVSTAGLVRTFTFDQRGRISSDSTSLLDSSAALGTHEISGRTYTWRPDGVLTGVFDLLRGTIGYTTDALGRVTEVTRTPHPHDLQSRHNGDELYAYSGAGMLNAHNNPDYDHHLKNHGKNVEAIDFSGTMPTRVGRTSYSYDALGRVVETRKKRIGKKPLITRFYYRNSSPQPVGCSNSDEPTVGYRYYYDGIGRRVAKEKIDTRTHTVLSRTVFSHVGSTLVGEHTTKPTHGTDHILWTFDPENGQLLAQSQVTTSGTALSSSGSWLTTTDLSGLPLELIDPDSGTVVGHSISTLFGQRLWQGEHSCPLLFTGQYFDAESGWAYNRFRYYHPHAGIYNAQDPLGQSPQLATAQGYVSNPTIYVDSLGLKAHDTRASQLRANVTQGRKAEKAAEGILKRYFAEEGWAKQVTFAAIDETRSRIDFVLKVNGDLHFFEIKSGGARLTKNQAVIAQTLERGKQIIMRTSSSDKIKELGIVYDAKVTGTFYKINMSSEADVSLFESVLKELLASKKG
ncbi:MAG: RHS repeat-associated core domain-containing protein [Corynebacterium sp.]|uniref:DUF6531 domain-containing protein n=1 Tax=Corynebacterium sp. TaxID=1720 RepID=UPI0026DD62A4|nr:RHS repeat-associated core domain-containing protein [Corynebacterium sp.]MDO4762462.1 RHS repeat-associated core domain-containing protein [Corynebacterium sp.]